MQTQSTDATQATPIFSDGTLLAIFQSGDHNCLTFNEFKAADSELTKLYRQAERSPDGGSKALWRHISYLEGLVGA